jgi:hypothetical protein
MLVRQLIALTVFSGGKLFGQLGGKERRELRFGGRPA